MYEFDIKTLYLAIKNSWKRIVINCSIALIIGAIISFSIPKEYATGCTLAPETQDEGMAGGLSNLASMAGINLGGGTDAIGPDLYPDVISSNKFIVDMLYMNVETIDGKRMTFLDYMKNETRRPWWFFFKKLFAQFMKAINPQPKFTASVGEGEMINPERMSREDEALVVGIKSLFSCNVSDLDGTISISAQVQDPLVAKQLVDSASIRLQEFITQYRTNKACIDLEYYRDLENKTHMEYIKSQEAYATYCDSHHSTVLEAYETKRDALENEMSIAMNAYTQVKQQVQMAEAKVQERTPAFTILEKASVPNKHTSPRKIMIMAACIFVTFVFTIGWIYLKLLFFTRRED